jgi:hypothetical protein
MRGKAELGETRLIKRFASVPCSWRTGSFHRLVQFIVTSHPSKVASLLVGGFPGEGSELLKGHRSFSVVTAEERTTLDELIAKKLIVGNQLTEAGWQATTESPRIARGVNPIRSFAREQKMIVDHGTPALQASNRNDLTRQGRAGILAWPDAFDPSRCSRP